MILTKTELRWILALVLGDCKECKDCFDLYGDISSVDASFWKLRHDNMDALANKLALILASNSKRIEIK